MNVKRLGRRSFLKGAAVAAADVGLPTGARAETAAMAAGGAGDVHAIDVVRLQRKLADFGAYLPNRG